MTSPAAAAVSATGPTRPFPPVPEGPPPDVELVSLYALDGGSAADSESGVNGTVVGTWTSTAGDSLLSGVTGQSFYKNGGSAHITLPADNPTHNLSALSIGIPFQPTASGDKHIMFSASGLGGATAPGDLSIERLPDGRPRVWHVGQDGSLRHFGSGTDQGIDGVNLAELTAVILVLTLGPSGAKLYLKPPSPGTATLIGSIPQNTNGWNNARVKYIGTWVDGLQAPMQGLIDHIRIWSGELQLSGVAALENPVSVSVPSSPAVDLPYLGQYYGCAYASQRGAANTHHKAATDEAVSVFFFAERAGTIAGISWQVRRSTDGGYSGGDGGTYTIEIRKASAVTKRVLALGSGGQVMSRRTGYQPGNSAGNSSIYPNLTFTEQLAPLVAGDPYCIVWRNTHSNPTTNFVSDNVMMVQNFQTGGPSQGTAEPGNYQEPAGTDPTAVGATPVSVSGWSPVVIGGNEWYDYPLKAIDGLFMYNRMGPQNCALRYTDGQWVFHGSFPSGGTPAARRVDFTSTSIMARERFRVTRANRIVSGVFVRIDRLNSTTGTLTVRLEQGPTGDAHFPGNGTVIESVAVPHTAIFDAGAIEAVIADEDTTMDFPSWLWVPFTANRTLSVGTNYNLRLSVSSGLTCRMNQCGRWDFPATGLGPKGASVATWADWEAQRQVPWGAWEDSRGSQWSTDGGTTWAYTQANLSPIIFKCVTS